MAADGRDAGLTSARAVFWVPAARFDCKECVRSAGFVGAVGLLSLFGSIAAGGVEFTDSAGEAAAGDDGLVFADAGLTSAEEEASGDLGLEAELSAASVPLDCVAGVCAVVPGLVPATDDPPLYCV